MEVDVLADVASTDGVMGLTMECARCHSHKYDAIPHRDYYRFKAIFQGALDEHDWLSFKNRSLDIPSSPQLDGGISATDLSGDPVPSNWIANPESETTV